MPSSELFLLDPANRALATGASSRGRVLFRPRLGLVFLAAVLGACLLIAAWAGLEWFRWLMLQGDHSIVSGQVVGCRKDVNADGQPLYHVTYRYEALTATGPAAYTREQPVGRGTYARLRAGQSVSVRHHNLFPQVSRIGDDHSFRDGISLGALMGLPVSLYMGWQVKRCRREIRLGKRGQVLEGRVVCCTGRVDEANHLRIELHYRFTAPGGRVVRANESVDGDGLRDAPLPATDTPLAVLYLDARNYKVL